MPKDTSPIEYEVLNNNDPLENDKTLHLFLFTISQLDKAQLRNSFISICNNAESFISLIIKKIFTYLRKVVAYIYFKV